MIIESRVKVMLIILRPQQTQTECTGLDNIQHVYKRKA